MLRTLLLTSESLFGPLLAVLLRTAQQAKKEEFVVKAATAALLPQPKPWGGKAAAAKRKASQPPVRRICSCQRCLGTTPHLPFLAKQQGLGRFKRDKRKPAPLRGKRGGKSACKGSPPMTCLRLAVSPRSFPCRKFIAPLTPVARLHHKRVGFGGARIGVSSTVGGCIGLLFELSFVRSEVRFVL